MSIKKIATNLMCKRWVKVCSFSAATPGKRFSDRKLEVCSNLVSKAYRPQISMLQLYYRHMFHFF